MKLRRIMNIVRKSDEEKVVYGISILCMFKSMEVDRGCCFQLMGCMSVGFFVIARMI
jgi:hypothetical protein